ncbi:Transmembrane protein 19 [Phytophthora boehmeriae]|uniref:Transmembrane protein 19 n=1 Tax=Phytophthora boehmeriae TaxID=109152 RepID=A0A8T1VVY9_9STRA|nr:Transmembrane protein 19 [Phytophthora boehmeriae]
MDFTAEPSNTRSCLLASYIGHYACCAADTWASELGVLSLSEPRLITTLRRVPPGTNGAVSVLGLATSALGGAFIGVLYYAASLLSGSAQVQVITLGVVTGLFGSVLDSVLGATVQATYFDRTSRKICDESAVDGDVEHVCGVDLLSNEQVNVVSVLVTTAVSGVLATYLFS